MFDIIWYDYKDGDIENLIQNAKKRSRTEYVWLANNTVNYKDFNFRFFPNRHQTKYKHAWASHKNPEHYTTWLIPVNYDEGTVYHKELLLESNTKYYDVCCVDTKTHELHPHDYTVNFITTMKDTLELAVKKTDKPWLWVICDLCYYENFDFNWLPSNHEIDYIHCWPSETCEKGETFLINTIAYKQNKKEFNFNHLSLKRKPWPIINYKSDSLANNDFFHNSIYALYTSTTEQKYDVCIWENRPVVSLSTDNNISLVPRDCVVKNEIYEYPYLLKNCKVKGQQQDIVFISYDEPEADINFEFIIKKYPNTKRIHGVNGMENALKAAAEISTTSWFYAVFAKTLLHDDFDFSFIPDYWQKPKHYIFYSKNLVNDLEYGHMGIVLYNKNIVLNSPPFGEFGTDYTLSFDHQVIPIVSCYGKFNTTPYHSWRTAFREVHKLCEYNSKHYCIETQFRINTWTSKAYGKNSEWCLKGAQDGKRFYEKYVNDNEYRRNTFRWEWLRNYFTELYGNIN